MGAILAARAPKLPPKLIPINVGKLPPKLIPINVGKLPPRVVRSLLNY